jgi:hypothetical protein
LTLNIQPSTLAWARFESKSLILCGSSSAVERQLPKLDATGSIPVSRSIFYRLFPMLSRLNLLALATLCFTLPALAQTGNSSFLGFDRNDYPGDDALPALRKTFAFTSYWLNPPPGAKTDSWTGKRATLQTQGFGFLVSFNGRLYRELKSLPSPSAAGRNDGREAARSARKEGFPKGTVIFLDQEEGGRQLDEQKSYIYAFVDAVTEAGFRAGVYCSGIPFKESDGSIIDTARDLQKHAEGRRIVYWVTNDTCPPSPGCSVKKLHPSQSGISFAEVWQYAQSPRRPKFTAECATTYSRDRNCYAPDTTIHVDINSATSPDPSHGRD